MLSKDTIVEMVVNQMEKDAHRYDREITKNWIDEQLDSYRTKLNLEQVDVEVIEKLFREKVAVTVGEAAILISDEPRKEWLTEDKKQTIDWYYWRRFKDHFKTKDIPESVLKRTDTDTDRILSLIGDPESSSGFPCRGMVIGDVQAGKTNNYSALINKAADAGYKLIIVLTGTVEDLRQQTQERLDKDFVGSVSIAGKSSKDRETKIIGVGRSNDSRLPFCLTDRDDDIKKDPRYRISTISEPILVVTKKNKHPLQRLVTWLTSEVNAKNGGVEQPVLIIDDEADNASVNTGNDDEDPKTINRLIREVLHACRKSSYVAYTATPFANIFIHPDSEGDRADTDDLFPKDFIVALEPPNNYCGARYFFRNNEVTDRTCVEIEDAGEHLPITHKPGTAVTSIPKSLKEAIGAFLLACAIKDIRRNKYLIKHDHDSMLINMSRLTTVQSDITPLVDTCLDEYWNAITVHAHKLGSEVSSEGMKALYSIWSKHYEGCSKESWDEVRSSLAEMEKPKTVTVHSKSGDSLTYEKDGPKKQIAIGGLKLSRGLTLEGLVVSYFYRRSVMYDSLMQMGRWYGYRDGYQDLLRLWITSESLDWYAHISEASDDLREQAAEMQRRKMTPSEFGLRVQASPDSLMVTAANKMRTAKTIMTRLRFDNRLLETDCVDSRPDVIENNFDEFSNFLGRIADKRYSGSDIPKAHRQHIHFKNVDAGNIIKGLRTFNNHPSCGFWAENNLFLQYLEERSGDELAIWDVFVYQPNKPKEGEWVASDGERFARLRRGIVDKPKNEKNLHELRLSRKQSITSRGVEALGLTQDEIDAVEQGSGLVADKKYRAARKKPTLIFHVIKACEYDGSDRKNILSERDVLGWAISIPESSEPQPDVLWNVTIDWFEKYGIELIDESEL
ncbi:putative Endonuclease [Vibrio coralliirubri]|uniref:Z1 domain-containing protein n=1 Tax=Vibrio coralliirubri TaxID=1516159 RepID=UPI0006349383|nr:Z1 domain-containing protein [Vibrio coralliirubri]CDT42502.1 putative Endonuclease [Vibrio coralliirubri]